MWCEQQKHWIVDYVYAFNAFLLPFVREIIVIIDEPPLLNVHGMVLIEAGPV